MRARARARDSQRKLAPSLVPSNWRLLSPICLRHPKQQRQQLQLHRTFARMVRIRTSCRAPLCLFGCARVQVGCVSGAGETLYCGSSSNKQLSRRAVAIRRKGCRHLRRSDCSANRPTERPIARATDWYWIDKPMDRLKR